MLERLVNETLSWGLAIVCAVGTLIIMYSMSRAYELLNSIVMF